MNKYNILTREKKMAVRAIKDSDKKYTKMYITKHKHTQYNKQKNMGKK